VATVPRNSQKVIFFQQSIVFSSTRGADWLVVVGYAGELSDTEAED